jgi:FixJ family two-component response regulator
MSTRGPVVAIVDDDPRMLESLKDLLESAGYAAPASPPPDRCSSAGLASLDLLITDIGMPGTDGFELRDLVNRARPELPVFLITGRHEFADQDQAPGTGRRFFRKPFDAKALLAAVRDALRDKGNGG